MQETLKLFSTNTMLSLSLNVLVAVVVLILTIIISKVAKHFCYDQNNDHVVQFFQSISRFAMMREQAEREREQYLAMVSSKERAAQRGTTQSGPI